MSEERLVELLSKTMDEQYEKRQLITPQHTADFLLANGIIVPPCKLKDDVWFVEKKGYSESRISHGYVIRFDVRYMYGLGLTKNVVIEPVDTLEDRLYFSMFEWIGKEYFLSREEAEKKLEEKENET